MIAFIGAMSEEINEFLKIMDSYNEKTISNVLFYEGYINDEKCVLLKSGVGKINAAMTTTILLENYDVEGVVNIGTAGGLKDYLQVLDVVVGDRVANYDADVPGWDRNFSSEKLAFKADEKYIDIMKKIIEEEENRIYIGGIASGDSFVCKDEQVDYILSFFPDALCCEMEACGVASVCKNYDIPFIIIRSLSDIAVKENNSIAFEEYVSKASVRSAVWCKEFIKKLRG